MARVGVLWYTKRTDILIHWQSSKPLQLSVQLMDYGYDKLEPGAVFMDSILQSYMEDNPEEKSGSGVILRRYLFSWIASLIRIAYKTPILIHFIAETSANLHLAMDFLIQTRP